MEEVVTGYGLVEGPVWDPAKGLYFSDVLGGGVFLLDRAGAVSTAIPKRRGVGGMALHAEGGLIVGGRNIAWVDLASGETRVLLATEQVPGAIGFNDLTTDAAGRIYVGSLFYRVFADEPKPGFLHVIDLDGGVRTLSDGVMLTNGLGVSPDGTRIYNSDAHAGLVRVYGLKVAGDGSVWVADERGGRVAVFEPDGRHRMDVAVPRPMVTSLCFAGDDLRDLYVVTGSDGGPSETSGTVYRTRVEVAGQRLAPARVALG